MLAEAVVALVPTDQHKRHYADLKASLRDDACRRQLSRQLASQPVLWHKLARRGFGMGDMALGQAEVRKMSE